MEFIIGIGALVLLGRALAKLIVCVPRIHRRLFEHCGRVVISAGQCN
jgi:hypothetical protein